MRLRKTTEDGSVAQPLFQLGMSGWLRWREVMGRHRMMAYPHHPDPAFIHSEPHNPASEKGHGIRRPCGVSLPMRVGRSPCVPVNVPTALSISPCMPGK